MDAELLKQCNEILGQNILNHVLCNRKVRKQLLECTSLKEVNEILSRRYKNKHGRKLSLPGGWGFAYTAYRGENNEDFVKPLWVNRKKSIGKPPTPKKEKKPKTPKKRSLVGDYLWRNAGEINLSENNNGLKSSDNLLDKVVKRMIDFPDQNFHYED